MDTPNQLTQEEEALYDLSDEELEKQFKEAKKNISSEENVVESQEEDSNDDVDQPSKESKTTAEESITGVNEDQPTDDDGEQVEDKPQPVAKRKIKANGVEFEFTEQEILEKFDSTFRQALDYTKKTQELAPWRRTISAIKENGLSDEDINLLIEAKRGSKEAVTAFLKQTGVDPLDLDMEQAQGYRPRTYGKDDTTVAIEEVVEKIYRDPEYTMTQDVVDRQWDNKSRQALSNDPSMIEGLHYDIRTGVFKDVYPEAIKLKLSDGSRKSDLEYYLDAGQAYYAKKAAMGRVVGQEQSRQQAQKTVQDRSDIRKAAVIPKSKAGKKSVVDYLEDNDEEFDEWYKKLKAKM